MKKLLYACTAIIIYHLAINIGACSAQTVQIYRGASAIGSPYSSLSAAIAAAANGDSLKMSAHTFNEHGILVNKILVIAGTINSGDTTVIDAQTLGRVIVAKSRTITIRDIILTNGKASMGGPIGSTSFANAGGGIAIDTFCNLTICGRAVIRNNEAYGLGGGIADIDNASSADSVVVTIKDNAQVSYNKAFGGGGIALLSIIGGNNLIRLKDNVSIHHNELFNPGISFTTGGGISCDKLIIEGVGVEGGVRVAYNRAVYGGGIFSHNLYLNGTVNVSNNIADSIGGGIAGVSTIYGTGKMLVSDNSAVCGGGAGNLFYVGGDSATLILSNNKAKYGGGLGNIGVSTGTTRNKNLIIFNNTADIQGGGAYFVEPSGTKFVSLINANIYNNKSPFCNGVYARKNAQLVLSKCRLFNPLASGAHSNNEVYIADNSTVSSDGTWFGESDTTGLIGKDASSAIDLPNWLVCTWVLNNGVAVGWAPFPLTAKFKLSTGVALPSGSFKMLEGRFSGTLGSFSPALATMKSSNEIESIFKATVTGSSSIMGIVDADTFKVSQAVTGIAEVGFERVKIFPNPAKDYLNINGLTIGSEVALYDLAGDLMKNEKVKMNNIVLDIKNLPAGTYILKITTAEGREGSAKIIMNGEF